MSFRWFRTLIWRAVSDINISYPIVRADGSALFQEMVGSKRGNWEESNMILEINKVRNKEMSIRQASDHFSVPKSSLGDRLKALAAGKEVKYRQQWHISENVY